MTYKHKPKKLLCWCAIPLEKHGSFEDFLFELEKKLRKKNIWMHLVTMRGTGDSVREYLKTTAIEHTEVDHPDIENPKKFLEIAMKVRPHLIHFHLIQMTCPVIAASNLCVFSNIIFTEHSSAVWEEGGLLYQYRKMKRTLNVSSIDFFLGVSDFISNRVRDRMWFPSGRVRTIHNGIQVDRYEPVYDVEQKKQLRKEKFDIEHENVVLFCGRYDEVKGFQYLVKLQQRLARERPDIFFIFIGFGPLDHLLPPGRGENVLNLGKRSDVNQIMPMADVFLGPSTWGEAFGLTFAEASSCGVPVIATTKGGIPEIVRDGETGYLIPANDEKAIYDSLIRFFDLSQDERLQMGQRGRRRIEERFDILDKVGETVEIYEHLLDKSKQQLRSLINI